MPKSACSRQELAEILVIDNAKSAKKVGDAKLRAGLSGRSNATLSSMGKQENFDVAAAPASLGQRTKETLTFLRAWAKNPRSVGAIAPSSPALAGLITREITSAHAPIVELGAGTGVFTRKLLAQGVREEDLILIEESGDMAKLLSEKFPEARVIQMDASHPSLADHIEVEKVGAVVSGLPLLSLPSSVVDGLLANLTSVLDTEAYMYQFTYSWRSPIRPQRARQFGLEASRVGRVLFNLPPATVYRYRMA